MFNYSLTWGGTKAEVILLQLVPRENGCRMNDWIQNRVIFIYCFQLFDLKEGYKILENSNLMQVSHEIAWEIIILKIQPVTKTN